MESFAGSREDLNEQETKPRTDLETADELLDDATSKVDDSLFKYTSKEENGNRW